MCRKLFHFIQKVSFLYFLGLPLAAASQSILTGKIYRVSFEPVGVIFSMQDGNGKKLESDPDNCGNDQLVLLSAKHDNYQVLKLNIFSAYHNQKDIDVQLKDCKFGLPQIQKFTLNQ